MIQQTIEMEWVELFLLSILVLVLALNSYATYAVIKSELATRHQRILQISLIWVLPIVGSLLALAVHKKDKGMAKLAGLENPASDNFGGSYDSNVNHHADHH